MNPPQGDELNEVGNIFQFPVDFRKKSSTNSLEHLMFLAIGHGVHFVELAIIFSHVPETSLHQFVPY